MNPVAQENLMMGERMINNLDLIVSLNLVLGYITILLIREREVVAMKI
ncbi:MAG: hypothetical protein AAGF83_15580 [Cyanobacteria bacterium P01_G01_bin.67]